MKRIAILAFGLLLFSACEDDPVVTDNSYPTDGLALSEVRTSILLNSYNPSLGFVSETGRLLAEDAYPNTFTHLSLVNDPGSPLYSAIADSIYLNQPLAAGPSFYVNDQTVDPALLLQSIDDAQGKRPIAVVNHAVTTNDTAWIIDSKVQFFRDTVNPGFRIATYMATTIKAKNYNGLGINLNTNPASGLVKVENDATLWEVELDNSDTTRKLTAVNDTFMHRNVMVKNFNPESAWGFSFEEYSPFGQSFSEGDIIGTRTTPIRHYFLRPESGESEAHDPGYDYSPSFITIIWVQNQDTDKYEYINSVMTSLD